MGTTPAAWNAGVLSLIRQISETVILPIAGLVLTYVAVYELIQMLIDRNNLHDIDTWMFFKWIFKTATAILILSNTFNIEAPLVIRRRCADILGIRLWQAGKEKYQRR